jgi:hypothetical protein
MRWHLHQLAGPGSDLLVHRGNLIAGMNRRFNNVYNRQTEPSLTQFVKNFEGTLNYTITNKNKKEQFLRCMRILHQRKILKYFPDAPFAPHVAFSPPPPAIFPHHCWFYREKAKCGAKGASGTYCLHEGEYVFLS